MKNYWKAFVYLFVAAFVYQMLFEFFPGFTWFFTLLWIFILLGFGFLMSPNQKRNSRWLGKVLISIFVIFTIGFRLKLFAIVGLDSWFIFKGIGSSFQDLFLVFSGWAFYQV